MNDVPLIGNNATDIAIGADAVAGALDLAEVALFKEDIAITRNTTYAELEAAKATFDGYAVKVVTWSAATIADDGIIEYLGSTAEFRPTGSVVTNGIFGLYVRNAGHTASFWAARFESPPLPMESTLDSIRVTLRYRPGANSLAAYLS